MGELLYYDVTGQVEGLRGRARMAVSLTRGEEKSPATAHLLFVMVPGGDLRQRKLLGSSSRRI